MWTLGEVVPVAFAVTARVRGSFSRERLEDAIEYVRRRHPMLAVRVTGVRLMSARITTEGVPSPPLRVAESPWDVAVAEELDRPFDAMHGPLTRFLVIDHGGAFDLGIVCHHLVGDGVSLAYVMRDIVAHLADAAAPPGELMAPTMRDLVKAMPEPVRSELLKQERSSWPVRPRTLGTRFALVNAVIEADESAELQQRCRAEGTSVHAALGLAGLRALADLDGSSRRQFYYPVNMRSLLTELPEGACGSYAVEFFTWFDVAADTGFWPAARSLKEAVRRQTTPDRLMKQVRLISLTNVLPNRTMGRLLSISCKPYASFTLTNLGRLPFASGQGEFRIESMHAAVHMGTLTNGLLAAVTVDDRICLSMSTTDSDRPVAEQTMKVTLGHLRTALD